MKTLIQKTVVFRALQESYEFLLEFVDLKPASSARVLRSARMKNWRERVFVHPRWTRVKPTRSLPVSWGHQYVFAVLALSALVGLMASFLFWRVVRRSV
jgi:hypothetical protein